QQRGARDAAVALLRRAQARYPGDFWINLHLARTLLDLEADDQVALEEAVGFFRTALGLRPRSTVVHVGLAAALYARRNLDDAEAACGKALALDPKLAPAHNMLGMILYARKDLGGAAAAYKKALEFDPKFAAAHNNLGNVLYDKGEMDA